MEGMEGDHMNDMIKELAGVAGHSAPAELDSAALQEPSGGELPETFAAASTCGLCRSEPEDVLANFLRS